MKKIISIFALALVSLACEKSNDASTPAQRPADGMLKLYEFFAQDSPGDFSVFVSSASGAGLFQSFATNNTQTVVQASSPDETYQGEISVNGTTIPFRDNRYYSLPNDTTNSQNPFIGQNMTFSLLASGAASIPSFSETLYCPAQTGLSYFGLDSNKLNLSNSLSVTWTPDQNLPNSSKAAFLLAGRDLFGANYTITSDIIEVPDSVGEHTFSSLLLSQFEDYPYLTVMYARGYNELKLIDDKEISFEFFGYSWTTIKTK